MRFSTYFNLKLATSFSLIKRVAKKDIITSNEAKNRDICKPDASATAPKIKVLSPFITKVTPSEKPDINPMFDGERSCANTCVNVCGARAKKPATAKRIKLVIFERNRKPSINGRYKTTQMIIIGFRPTLSDNHPAITEPRDPSPIYAVSSKPDTPAL